MDKFNDFTNKVNEKMNSNEMLFNYVNGLNLNEKIHYKEFIMETNISTLQHNNGYFDYDKKWKRIMFHFGINGFISLKLEEIKLTFFKDSIPRITMNDSKGLKIIITF